jgi:hypothetical protein
MDRLRAMFSPLCLPPGIWQLAYQTNLCDELQAIARYGTLGQFAGCG